MVRIRNSNPFGAIVVLTLIVMLFVGYFVIIEPYGIIYNTFMSDARYQQYTTADQCIAARGHWYESDQITGGLVPSVTSQLRHSFSGSTNPIEPAYTAYARYLFVYQNNSYNYSQEHNVTGSTWEYKTFNNPNPSAIVKSVSLELRSSKVFWRRYAESTNHNLSGAVIDVFTYTTQNNESTSVKTWLIGTESCHELPARAKSNIITSRKAWLVAPIIFVIGMILWLFTTAMRRDPTVFERL
jgi:hypothetical protein